MATYQDVLDGVALLVGGTAPDATNNPRWFSGAQSADGTGIIAAYGPAFAGCYSAPPAAAFDTPVGILLPGRFQVTRIPLTNGVEDNRDELHLWLLVDSADSKVSYANLNQYRDLVPAAFRAHMQLNNGSLLVNEAYVSNGEQRPIQWAGMLYYGWDFTITINRYLNVTYTAP